MLQATRHAGTEVCCVLNSVPFGACFYPEQSAGLLACLCAGIRLLGGSRNQRPDRVHRDDGDPQSCFCLPGAFAKRGAGRNLFRAFKAFSRLSLPLTSLFCSRSGFVALGQIWMKCGKEEDASSASRGADPECSQRYTSANTGCECCLFADQGCAQTKHTGEAVVCFRSVRRSLTSTSSPASESSAPVSPRQQKGTLMSPPVPPLPPLPRERPCD